MRTNNLLLSVRGMIPSTTSKRARSSSLQINLIAPNRGVQKTRNKQLRNTGNMILAKVEAEVEGVLGVANPTSTIMTIHTSDRPRSCCQRKGGLISNIGLFAWKQQ